MVEGSVMCNGEMMTLQNTQIEGSRPRVRPKLRWMDRLKEDMKQNKISPEWASQRESWFEMIQNVNPTQEMT